jgi:DNA-binding transcriptional MerR regulator
VADGNGDGLTVGEVARLSRVTVRTLHHYDRIGLVCPSGRTATGYRVYGAADRERLGQVLVYRRLGFPLDEIRALLDDPAVDTASHLRRQRQLLVERTEQLAAMVAAIDRRLEAQMGGMQLTPEEQLEVFGTDKAGGEWADEAAERWGGTAAYRESQRRTAGYTRDDWARIRTEADEGTRAFADALRAGLPADGPDAAALAERHRQHVTRWFYDCGYDLHVGLAELYLADERFTAGYERLAPGLAQYVHDAILANAAARG